MSHVFKDIVSCVDFSHSGTLNVATDVSRERFTAYWASRRGFKVGRERIDILYRVHRGSTYISRANRLTAGVWNTGIKYI